MAIAEQFAGLKMDELIGGPLSAAAEASTLLANSTADFINRVGFNRDGTVRTVAFSYQQRSINEDGTSNLEDMKVDVPMLAIVPIPNLQIDEVNVLFDMEVKQSEKSENSLDMGASISGSVNLGIVKVSVTGSVSAHSSNTRSSDNSAKYHVDVRATNHGIPEGLARVLDMMAVNLSPALVGSTLKDGNGQSLSEAAKKRAEALKALRQEISQLETSVSACRESLDANIKQMKRIGSSQLNVYQGEIHTLTNNLNEEDEKGVEYSKAMDQVNQSWNTFQNQTGEFIRMLSDSNQEEEKVSDLLSLKAINKEGQVVVYGETESYYKSLAVSQKNAVAAQKKLTSYETKLFEKKAEYSDMIAGGK